MKVKISPEHLEPQFVVLRKLGFFAESNPPFYKDKVLVQYHGEWNEFQFSNFYNMSDFDIKTVFNDLTQYIKQDTAEKYRQEIIKVIGQEKLK